MNGKQLITPKKASEILQISHETLGRWADLGKIICYRTVGGHRRYERDSIVTLHKASLQEKPKPVEPEKVNFCYARVSSAGQKEDLERQVSFFRLKYPNHRIIKDVGSGLNFKRKGLQTLLDECHKGNIGEIVVTHRDRLCRFGFELFEGMLQRYSHGKIVVCDQPATSVGGANECCFATSPDQEFVEDILSIITVFSARLHGQRSHRTKREIKNLKDQSISE